MGCDGSRSIVREQAGITQTLSDHDRLMVLLVFRSHELHRLLEQRYPGKSFYSVLHPDLEGYWKFFGRVDLGSDVVLPRAGARRGRPRTISTSAGYLHAAAGAEFDVEFEHIGFWELRFAIADTYRKGRIFIAGDAAHSHPPYGGYGVNLGLEDARNLGWKLAARLQGWAGANLLASYSAEAAPRVPVDSARLHREGHRGGPRVPGSLRSRPRSARVRAGLGAAQLGNLFRGACLRAQL